MTDYYYYPLIATAVNGLDESTPQARRSVYNRARTALLTKLGDVEPPLAEAEIARERLALEEAIRKIEREAERHFGNDPLRPSQKDENLNDMARRLEAALRRPIKSVEPAPEAPPHLGEAEQVHMSEPMPPPSNAGAAVKQALKRRAGELGRDMLREKTGLALTKLSPAEEKISEDSDGPGEAERVHMSEPVPPPSKAGAEVKQAIKRRAGELGRDLLHEKTGLAVTKLSPAGEKDQ
jgi:hypothetical protein